MFDYWDEEGNTQGSEQEEENEYSGNGLTPIVHKVTRKTSN
jgi:hypothetical protein